MNIWIDMITAHGADGKVISYYPEVHWNIDEHDTISPNAMNEICERLHHELDMGLIAAKIEEPDIDGLVH